VAADWAVLALVIAAICAALNVRARRWTLRTAERAARRAGRLVPRRALPTTRSRPIELIAHDVRRLGHRFHHPPRHGLTFVKYESTRWAYDKVLAEGCHALGIVHLLDVLPPGPELDAERRRVEWLLYQAGLDLDDAA
jgi:hypothetical protein